MRKRFICPPNQMHLGAITVLKSRHTSNGIVTELLGLCVCVLVGRRVDRGGLQTPGPSPRLRACEWTLLDESATTNIA